MDSDDLKAELKSAIIDILQLEDIKPSDIGDDEELFGGGLGLDSIDALELGVGLKKHFGVKFSADTEEDKNNFASVNALASYITSHKKD